MTLEVPTGEREVVPVVRAGPMPVLSAAPVGTLRAVPDGGIIAGELDDIGHDIAIGGVDDLDAVRAG